MGKILITSDSTCDLSDKQIKDNNIHIIPLYIQKGDKSYKDGIDIAVQDIYDYYKETGNLTSTSAVSIGDYCDYFSQFKKDGYEIVHISLSKEISSSYQNACIASEEIDGVYVVDSRNLSTGSGLVVLKACDLLKEGLSAKEIHTKLLEYTEKVQTSFLIDTLEYLHKGGRCSTVAALGANLLKLKPSIKMSEGKLAVSKKYRGSLQSCLVNYVEDTLKERNDIDLTRIFITHTGCSPETVSAVKNQVLQLQNFKEVYETIAGCTITAHCGPGTLGILFATK